MLTMMVSCSAARLASFALLFRYALAENLLAGSSTMDVRCGRDLAIAFASSAVDTALLKADVWMREADWKGLLGGPNGTEPVLLSHNFTIRSDNSLPAWPLLNLGFVKSKVRIANGVILTVRHVVVGDFRDGLITQAPGFDLAARTSADGLRGLLVHNMTAVLYAVCFPHTTWNQSLSTAPRAPAIPGNQSYTLGHPVIPIPYCPLSPAPPPPPSPPPPTLNPNPSPPNRTATSNSPTASALLSSPPSDGLILQPPLTRRCWADAGAFNDMAFTGLDVDMYGSIVPTYYDVNLRNVTYLCANVMQADCLARLTPLGCALNHIKSTPGGLPWRLPAAADAEVVVRNGRELAEALASSPRVAGAVLGGDVWMWEEDWEGLLAAASGDEGDGNEGHEPALLSADFTIRGDPGLAVWPLLNLGFVRRKIRIGSGVTLTLQHIILVDYDSAALTQPTPVFDLLAPTRHEPAPYGRGPGQLILNETGLMYASCFPPTAWNVSLGATPRPAARSGAQTFTLSIPQDGCVNATSCDQNASPTASTTGSLQPPLPSRCWAQCGVFSNVAFAAESVIANNGTAAASATVNQAPSYNYDVMMRDVSYMCATALSAECLAQGDDSCTASAAAAVGCGGGGSSQLPWRRPVLPPPSPSELQSAAFSDGGPRANGDMAGAVAGGGLGDGESGGGGGGGAGNRGGRKRLLAAVLGGALGVAALLALLLGAAFHTMSRRRKDNLEKGSGMASSRYTASPSSGDGCQGCSVEVALEATDLEDRQRSSSRTEAKLAHTSEVESGRTTAPSQLAGPASAAACDAPSRARTDTSKIEGSNEGASLSNSGGERGANGTGGGGSGGGGDGGGSYNVRAQQYAEAAPLAHGCPEDQAGLTGGLLAEALASPPPPTTGPLPAEDEHVVVTPLTPPRADLALGPAAVAEVTLLPVVRGTGAYGRVYEGMYCGERVAVKVMRDSTVMAIDAAGGLEFVRESFAQEVEVLGRCSHPNVVRLLAACLTPPRVVLVMELMETSLERLVYNNSGSAEVGGSLLPLGAVLHIALGVARGLEYLHPTILHRDLKPANILINNPTSPRPEAKITDFGVSRLRSTVLVTHHPEAGTPAYMAPETFDVNNYTLTHHVDLFSFGVLLWVMLTGRRPWQGLSMVQVAYRVTIARGRLPLAALLPHRCPPELRALIMQCWEHEPRRRPAAAEVVKILQGLLQAETEQPF